MTKAIDMITTVVVVGISIALAFQVITSTFFMPDGFYIIDLFIS
ncbi:hypothetical protein [Halobacillus hunanensis]|nr:hypothetical protein [Halobacillus hunanensis]